MLVLFLFFSSLLLLFLLSVTFLLTVNHTFIYFTYSLTTYIINYIIFCLGARKGRQMKGQEEGWIDMEFEDDDDTPPPSPNGKGPKGRKDDDDSDDEE